MTRTSFGATRLLSTFAVLSGLACGGDDGCNGPTCAAPPTGLSGPHPTRETSVTLGSDVPTAAATSVQRVYSLFQSVALGTSTRLRVPAEQPDALVMATNAAGDLVLAGTDRAGGPTTLDARSTALALTELLLTAPFVPANDRSTLDARVTAHRLFGPLVSAVQEALAGGQSQNASATEQRLAGTVALDVLASAASASAPRLGNAAATETAAIGVPGVPVSVDDGAGTAYSLTNSGYVRFDATSLDGVTGAVIDSAVLAPVELKLLSLTPSFGSPTITTLAGRDGEARIVLGQSVETQAYNDQQYVERMFGLLTKAVFESLGLKVGETFVSAMVERLLTPSKIQQIVSAPQDAFWIVVDAAASNLPLLAEEAFKEQAQQDVVAVVLGNVFKSVVLVDQAGGLVNTLSFAREYVAYKGSMGVVFVCQTNGTFEGCVDAVEVSPTSTIVQPGGSVTLTAILKDLEGNSVPVGNRPITWESSDPTVATVSGSGAEAAVTGVRQGTVTVTATSRGKTGWASVSVQ